ncbi:MAG: PEP-CTERM sorting domain-containing protein, partial [Kiritimatiellaeota bacterium]|nr:PEP-CTERM sorting domain-containing protein [Kiritimatiellota bacterium]
YTVTLRAATGGTTEFKTGTWTSNDKALAIGSSGNTGTVKLSNALATTGGISVNYGTFLLGAGNLLGDTTPVTVAGGTLDIGGNSDTVGAVSLTSGSITGSGGTLTGSSYDVRSGSVSAILGGSGIALTKSTGGTVTLSNANTYTGNTAINNGTLALSGSGSIASTNINVAAGATFDVSGRTGGSYTLGAGQTLQGQGATTGGLIMDTGSTLSPGNSTGTNTFYDALTLKGNTNVFELVTTSDHDMTVVASTGSLTLQNKPILDVRATGLVANPDDVFVLFDNQSSSLITLTDTFWLDASTQLGNNATFTAGAKSFRINYDAVANGDAVHNDIILTVIPEPTTLQLLMFLGTAFSLRRKLRQPQMNFRRMNFCGKNS